MVREAFRHLPPPVRTAARTALRRVPVLGELLQDRDALRAEVAALRAAQPNDADARQFVPPGHFYSAIPSLREVLAREERLFGAPPRALAGLDVREDAQLALLESFLPWYRELPFPEHRSPRLRYFYENPAYSYSDAICLHFMIRHARPRRIVEVGSGYSSCVTLDTNDLHLGGAARCTFVEPYPELLLSLLHPGDRERIELLARPVQDVPLATFERLEAGDILFIDSTHVAKIGSDVNHLYLEVLPRLAPGVYVHVHDVFWPFEYPREWILEGRAWNELYLLRAFLGGNPAWEIVLMNTFLEQFHEAWFAEHMPLCLRNRGGSVWLRKRG